MKRVLWIVGLYVALLMFVFTFAVSVAGLLLKEHLNVRGWGMLVGSVCGAWYSIGRIRVTLRRGDPGADLPRPGE